MLKLSKITKEARKHKSGKWNVDLEFVLTFYDAYIREKNLAKVARSMDMGPSKLLDLIEKHEELKQAKNMADDNRGKNILGAWCVSMLSPESRKTWEKINSIDSFDLVQEVFKGKSVKLKQEVFCQAMLHTGFNSSKACQMVGIRYRDLEMWKTDFDFCQMLEELQFHKKNFFENSLVGLVEERYPGAVLFVNRTLNADRGYGEKLQIEEKGGNVSQFDISDLDLDLPTMKKVLAAIDAHKAKMETEAEKHPMKMIPAHVK